MRSVSIDDISGLSRYEAIRDEFRRGIIQLKRARRVPVGDRVTFVFENFDTVLFQIQEMLRAENIGDLDKVREELAVYNELIPATGELSSTMLIEITQEADIRAELVRLIGIDECVTLIVGDHRVPGVFEGGRSKEDKLSAVQYVRFAFDAAARAAFLDPQVPARLVIEHANYSASTDLAGAVRDSLRLDLRDE